MLITAVKIELAAPRPGGGQICLALEVEGAMQRVVCVGGVAVRAGCVCFAGLEAAAVVVLIVFFGWGGGGVGVVGPDVVAFEGGGLGVRGEGVRGAASRLVWV